MKGPEVFVRHLAAKHYHPRSDAHSNAVCRAILGDLLDHCAPLAEKAKRGEIVAKLNHSVTVNYQDWNIDLALGPPPSYPVPPPDGGILMDTPATVQIALEAKSIFTEHGKARRNRLRDLQAFHGYAHLYNPKTVAIATVAINISDYFWSPLRQDHDITFHRDIGKLAAETVRLFRGLPVRNSLDEPGLEGFAIMVIRHDNLLAHPRIPSDAPTPRPTTLVTAPPSPPVGDPMHYASMIQRTCRAFAERWA